MEIAKGYGFVGNDIMECLGQWDSEVRRAIEKGMLAKDKLAAHSIKTYVVVACIIKALLTPLVPQPRQEHIRQGCPLRFRAAPERRRQQVQPQQGEWRTAFYFFSGQPSPHSCRVQR